MDMVDAFSIKQRYGKKGYTQEQFAELAGMSRQTLSTILKSGQVKKREHLIGMALALDVEESALLAASAIGVDQSVNQSGKSNNQQVNYRSGDQTAVIEQLERELQALKRENELLTKIVELQKGNG